MADLATTVINKLWPDKSEQERAQMAAALTMVQGQLDANREQAKNPNWFVSGPRPFVMWCCGAGCAWNWLLLPIAKLALALAGKEIALQPADMAEMMPLLVALLGLGAYRTYEKTQGVALK